MSSPGFFFQIKPFFLQKQGGILSMNPVYNMRSKRHCSSIAMLISSLLFYILNYFSADPIGRQS